MKIWFDILTPKQLLFFDQMLHRLKRDHQILCTSRRYGEVSRLIRIRGDDVIFVGSFGGPTLYSKLMASAIRLRGLLPLVRDFSPDVAVSFCSPEAARISFGLGVRHIAFNDTPYSPALRLCLPLSQKLLTPWLLSLDDISKMGISKKDIIQYRAIDAAITLQARRIRHDRLPMKHDRTNILVRAVEEQAAYHNVSCTTIPIIQQMDAEFPDANIVVITRYPEQRKAFRKILSGRIRVIGMSYDGRDLLDNTDVFVGSGGTMTAESALMGVPTISYNAVPNVVEEFLISQELAVREIEPAGVASRLRTLLESESDWKRRAKQTLDMMEDPYPKLLAILNT
ncbi:MAG: DUF354 domain-containing protein [Cenarchaeum sp. SB0662_bin_33]|nr:DUF354 domain-containing protein [Cenarchaeum sp. SB0662_bin_33]